MPERMEVECRCLECLNRDDHGCVKGYIEIKDGCCVYYEPIDEDEEE